MFGSAPLNLYQNPLVRRLRSTEVDDIGLRPIIGWGPRLGRSEPPAETPDNTDPGSIAYARLIQSAETQKRTADVSVDSIVNSANVIAGCFRLAKKLLICGNGGSAADAQHMAAEFVNRLSNDF